MSTMDAPLQPVSRTDNPFFDHHGKTILFPGTKNVFQKECFPFECRRSMAISRFLEKTQ